MQSPQSLPVEVVSHRRRNSIRSVRILYKEKPVPPSCRRAVDCLDTQHRRALEPQLHPRYPQLPISYRPLPIVTIVQKHLLALFLYKITQTPSTPKGRFFLWCCAYITIASHTDDPTAYFHSPSLVICFLLHLLHLALPFVHSIPLYTTPTALHHTQDKRSPSHCADVLHLDTPSFLPSRSIN